MKFTQIPAATFQQLQMNAGILVDSFNPVTGAIGNLLGATSGGITFSDSMDFSDWGDDIDNCPKNMKELKHIDDRTITMGGTFVTVTAAVAKMLAAAADLEGGHIIPRADLVSGDFTDLWWVGDYSDKNTGANAGYIAIHLKNALNTSGFQITTGDKAKGQFAFEFTGHYSLTNQAEVPYEVYVKGGDAEVTPEILLDSHYATVVDGDTVTLTATTVPAGETITWSSSASNVASVSNGVITGESEGSAIITASITYNGVTVTDTCTVVVVAEEEGE